MNIEDLLVNGTLNQDKWSLLKETFGEQGQLKVIGWSGKAQVAKYYILKCSICSEDGELFGQGVFKAQKGALKKGCLPCGCSKNHSTWSTNQWEVRARRAAELCGFSYLGFKGETFSAYSKLLLRCPIHGMWDSSPASAFISCGTGCPKCAVDTRLPYNKK